LPFTGPAHRVERITSVSNYGDAKLQPPDAAYLARMMAGALDSGKEVTTRVQVWVNFVLVPR
jgi:hypothetical protein